MSAPVWLLDFDGVINAISTKGDRSVHDDWRHGHAYPDDGGDGKTKGFPILWSPSVVDVIVDAVDRGVNVTWLTTWRKDTVLLPDVVNGLPRDLPWLDEDSVIAAAGRLDPMNVLGQRWKVQCAEACVDPHAPMLWTDDMHSMFLNTVTRDRIMRRPGGTTLVTPHETIGLSRKNLRVINAWLDDYAPRGGSR